MITIIIIAATCLFSYLAFNNKDLMMRMMFIPYVVHERNEFQRALTHVFIHADWMHLIFNMFVLYNFGPFLERKFVLMKVAHPQVHFALLYFGAGLFATLIPFARHKLNPRYMALGASGSVAGILFHSFVYARTAVTSKPNRTDTTTINWTIKPSTFDILTRLFGRP